MTRAERYMQIHAELYAMDLLAGVIKRLSKHAGLTVAGTTRPTRRSELIKERNELRRQMGRSDRRELARLMAKWENKSA